MIKKILITSIICISLFITLALLTAYAEEYTEPTTSPESVTEPVTEPITKPVKNGFYKENGATYLYVNDVKKTGLVKYNAKKYYFSKSGKMKTGFVKIENDTYYFAKTGEMKTGLVKVNNKYYYFKSSGKRYYGFKKIGKYRYYFKDKTGAAKTGFLTRKINGKKVYTYYGKTGKLKTGSFKVGNAKYKSTLKLGFIYSCKNITPAISQRPKLKTGCEIVSWTMMANYAGVKINKYTAANVMPRNPDPNKGFAGNPYRETGGALVVYPGGLKSMTEDYLGSFVNMTNCSLAKIKYTLYKNHLVMAWLGNINGFYSHTVALTGYDRKYIYYNNPWAGKKEKMTYSTFKVKWSANHRYAMSY